MFNCIATNSEIFWWVVLALFSDFDHLYLCRKTRENFFAGSLTSCGNVTQWPLEPIPPCFSMCTLIHGEILQINCCSISVKPSSWDGCLPGFILLADENIFSFWFVSITSLAYTLCCHEWQFNSTFMTNIAAGYIVQHLLYFKCSNWIHCIIKLNIISKRWGMWYI